MSEAITADKFWQFSLQLYPQVKPLCLQWQDELGVNVNLLLLLCYLEQQQLSFSSTELQQLAAKLENFSAQFTRPLRQLRRSASEAGVDDGGRTAALRDEKIANERRRHGSERVEKWVVGSPTPLGNTENPPLPAPPC